ncbi:MAG TPA: fasciclin domain-containing protein [Nitriliruptoraceae bacterium]|nr:fasciclin domain-containing protein [Nitriliruptoraceae bacterium]
MRKLTTTALAIGLTVAMAGPAAAAKPGWAGPDNGSTIVETAIELSGDPLTYDDNGGDFDILVTAVIATGATAVLDGSTDYTVFAPTDQAFLDAAGTDDEEEAVEILVGAFGVDGILDILTYHITDGWRPSPSVVNARKITMLDGNTITAREGFVDANNSDADFVLTDVKTTDGGIHVIDTVLLP